MARIKIRTNGGGGNGNISEMISNMSAIEIGAMVGGFLTGLLLTYLIDKLLQKTGWTLGITYYIMGGIVGLVLVGIAQIYLKDYLMYVNYGFIGLGVLVVLFAVYRMFFVKGEEAAEEHE